MLWKTMLLFAKLYVSVLKQKASSSIFFFHINSTLLREGKKKKFCIPSSSSEAGPAFELFGVFMKSGKMVRSPRISTNFWLLSTPSTPVMAWLSTFIAQFRDNFFSLWNVEILTSCSKIRFKKKTSAK